MDENKESNATTSDTIAPADSPEAEPTANEQKQHPLVYLLLFLQSPQGSDLVKKLGEAWNASQTNATRRHAYALLLTGACVFMIVGAVIWLSCKGAIDPTAGVILGGLAGYLFGKRKD